MGTIRPPSTGDNDVQRRSQRVILKVTVVVLAQGSDNKLVSEVTRTVTVNVHGALRPHLYLYLFRATPIRFPGR
jgi:phosphopantetheine adenylyltransferase